MNQFIRVSNDLIINVSAIFSICRQSSHSNKYEEWNHEYVTLLQDVVKSYMNDNIDILDDDEDKIADALYEKFAPVVRKNLIDSIGECPEPFDYYYLIKLNDGSDICITEEIFQSLTKIINVDMSKDIDNHFMYDESIE